MKFSFIFSILFITIDPSKCHTQIPSYLQECYTNETINGPHLPMNLQIFLDIIRKAEKYSEKSIDLRIFSSSLLHRFKFDGIEYDGDLQFEDGVLPFSGTGSQRTKNKLIEELIPGNYKYFPVDALTKVERCALHRALSNTIQEHDYAATDKFCTERPTEKISNNFVPTKMKSCPLECGVILTPFGTIAPSALITGIAAALQPQNIAVKLLLGLPDFTFNDDEVDIMIPKSEMMAVRSMWLNSILSSNVKLDNVWASTVAGDLAEMAVYQGPLLGNRMVLGGTGFWNSTMRPQIFYLLGKDGSFDATRAEIIGTIDGFIIAENLKKWITSFNTLRLSEILDMYYSSKGMGFDSTIKACTRGKSFWQVASTTILEQQVYGVSQILAYRRSIAHMTNDTLKKMSHYSVTKFNDYVNNHIFPELHCKDEEPHPRVEILVTSDGAWSQEYTVDFLAVLLNDLNITPFGSRIGFLHGSTGKWLLNMTNSASTAYLSTLNETTTNLNLVQIFESTIEYYTSKWHNLHKNHIIGGMGQVILILAPRLQLNDSQIEFSLAALKNLRSLHPDINVLYYSTPENSESMKKLLIAEEDYLITSLEIKDITKYLLEIPHSLRPGPCNPNISHGIRDQVEGYVYPQEVNIYRLDPEWRIKTKQVTMKIVGFGYGLLEICMWSQRRNSVRKELFTCRELSGNNEIELTDYDACEERNCPAIYYKIRGLSSSIKCAEIDCRRPEYIRYLMRVENIQCSVAGKFTPSLITTMLLLFFIRQNII